MWAQMASSNPRRPSPEVLAALRRRLPAGMDCLALDRYIDCVLYDPGSGYYTAARQRVGRAGTADFYTASSLGSLFSRMVVAAAADLLGPDLPSCTFVEAGPESAGGILGRLDAHPFGAVRLVRPGDPLHLAGRTVFFSNELFDAQPFRRFVRQDGQWLEAGVALHADQLDWIRFQPLEPLPLLPEKAPEGYVIDWPSGAHALLEAVCRQDWKGLFLAFDYGLDRRTVFSERPDGTGRTYSAHRMGGDLLADPGKVDITCHLVWDEMERILAAHGFRDVRLERQESFFMHHAGAEIRRVLENSGHGLSREKQTLMELLHPDNMGHKFQVLSARRGDL